MSEQEQERRARLVEENHALRERVNELKRANDKLIRDKGVVYARVLELEEETGRLERELADARDVCDAGWMRADELRTQLAEQLAEQLPQPSERGKAMIERARATTIAEVAADFAASAAIGEPCAVCHRAMYPDDLRACSGQDDPGGPCVPVSVAKVRGWR